MSVGFKLAYKEEFGAEPVYEVRYKGHYIGVYDDSSNHVIIERPTFGSVEYEKMLAQILNAINARWGVEPFVDEIP